MTTTPAPKGADIDQYRPGFEAWYAPTFAGGEVANMPRRSNGEYVRPQCQIAWLSWIEAKSSTSTSQGAAPGDALDAQCWRYIEEHATTHGGGHGFTITCFVPVDHEDMACGVLAAIAASTSKGEGK